MSHPPFGHAHYPRRPRGAPRGRGSARHGFGSAARTHLEGGRLCSFDREHNRPPSKCVRAADRKSTRLNSSHVKISYAVFCLKKKNKTDKEHYCALQKKEKVALQS